ncbi:MAG: MotA/TolQ/ExbB proton channel family protein [Alphaproteobacteria bacterium]
MNSSLASPVAAAGHTPDPLQTPPRRQAAQLNGWFSVYGADDPLAHRHLLIMRFAVVNLVGLAMLAAVWMQGWLDIVLKGDATRLVLVIAAVFLAGLFLCAMKVLQVGTELDRIRAPAADPKARVTRYLASIAGKDGPSRALAASSLKLKLASRIAVVRHIAGSLVFLGLIGTVIGFMIALSGVDPELAADISAVGPMVSTLISGMSVALSTTLVGAVLNIWLMVNYRLLESGTTRLLTSIVELGECHAGP